MQVKLLPAEIDVQFTITGCSVFSSFSATVTTFWKLFDTTSTGGSRVTAFHQSHLDGGFRSNRAPVSGCKSRNTISLATQLTQIRSSKMARKTFSSVTLTSHMSMDFTVTELSFQVHPQSDNMNVHQLSRPSRPTASRTR